MRPRYRSILLLLFRRCLAEVNELILELRSLSFPVSDFRRVRPSHSSISTPLFRRCCAEVNELELRRVLRSGSDLHFIVAIVWRIDPCSLHQIIFEINARFIFLRVPRARLYLHNVPPANSSAGPDVVSSINCRESGQQPASSIASRTVSGRISKSQYEALLSLVQVEESSPLATSRLHLWRISSFVHAGAPPRYQIEAMMMVLQNSARQRGHDRDECILQLSSPRHGVRN